MLRTRFLTAVCFCLATMTGGSAMAQSAEDQLIAGSSAVMNEIMAIPAKAIPQSLLAQAQGIAIIPNMVKGGFVIGIKHGRGVICTRNEAGQWQAPLFISMTGGSLGWQAGLQTTDVILVFKTRKSINGLMTGKLTIGADAAAAAGPVGRQASAATDARLGAEILSYSRSRGLFAGLSIDGSSLQVDHAAGMAYYRNPNQLPPAAANLVTQLTAMTKTPVPAAATAQNVPMPSNQQLVPTSAIVGQRPPSVKRRLADSSLHLAELLDPQWQQYLKLPAGVYSDDIPVNVPELQAALKKFNDVAADPRYQSLARRPEFTITRQLLVSYLNESTSAPGQIDLPAPPAPVVPGQP